jgi:hypothetical protein
MRLAAWLALAVGCANPAKMEEQPHLDFGLPDNDLAMEMPDLAVASGDLAHSANQDLATTTVDMTPPADMLPPPSCDDAGTTGHLFLAAAGAANALVTSRFDGSNWSAYQTQSTPTVTDVAITLHAARPQVVARQLNTTLSLAGADPCSQNYGALTPIAGNGGTNATTAMRPSVIDEDILFRGSIGGDQNLYYVQHGSSLPSQQTALTTTMPFALVRFGGVLHALINKGGDLWDGVVQPDGMGAAAHIGSLTVGQPPTAVVDPSGNLHVVYVTPDSNINWVMRPAGGAFGTSHLLCDGQAGCLIDTNLPIALALDSSGTPIVAWVGISGHQVYTAKLLSAAGPQFWTTPTASSGTCTFGDARDKDCQTTVGPALATGIGGASAELVFVSDYDGRARHARLTGSWSQPVSIAGTNLLNTPALISEP